MQRIRNGTIRFRSDKIKKPAKYAVDTAHLRSCTSCFEREYRASLHRLPFAPRAGEAQLLVDDHAIGRHTCIARAYHGPSEKAPLNLSLQALRAGCDRPERWQVEVCYTTRARHFGMYGTVLAPSRASPRYRMWLGREQIYYTESADGLAWAPLSEATGVGGGKRFEMCISHDAAHGRLLMGHHCGNSHESVCIASAPDTARADERWTPLGGRARAPPNVTWAQTCGQIPGCCGQPCAHHADSYNCVRWGAHDGAHWLLKRAAFGNHELASQWRAVRGIVVARNPRLDANSSAFEPVASWYLDREGKAERYRRQIYSLTLSDAGARAADAGRAAGGAAAREEATAPDGVQLGLLTVLQWPGVGSKASGLLNKRPPFWFDIMSVYLLPTRDGGRTFDLSAVYADARLLPIGGCPREYESNRTKSRTFTSVEVNGTETVTTVTTVSTTRTRLKVVKTTDVPHVCEFDAGYVEPASELLSTREHGHVLYYEGRPAMHDVRFWRKPTIARARWPLHRLAGVRVDPACAAPARAGGAALAPPGECGQLETRPFELRGTHRVLSVNARVPPADGAVASSLTAALVDDARVQPIAGHERGAPAAPAVDAADAVLQWAGAKGAGARSRIDAALAGRRVRLRFELCGATELFAFTLRAS